MGAVRIAVASVVALTLGLAAGSASGEHAAARTFAPVVSGLSSPDYVTSAPGDPTTLYVVEQPGTIKIVRNGAVAGTFLDIRSRIKSGGEQGLLSVAFHPQYATNHRFYVDYTDTRGDTRVVEFRSANGVGKPATARQLLFVDQPYDNHNGGQLEFDKNGYLYVGMGDGGSGGDPENRAQNLKSRLGKLLRINPTRKSSAWQIVGFGLRNPWRFSFDRANGNLWIGDVGQNAWEEVDYRNAARVGRLANYGWSRFEGKVVYDSHKPLVRKGDLISPVLVYSHSEGLLDHRRLRLSRLGGSRCAGPLLLWGLLQRHGLELPRRERQDRRAARRGQGRPALVVRPGRQRRAVFDVAERHALPAALANDCNQAEAWLQEDCSAGPPAPHVRRLRAECRVGQRLQRLVERRELARQPEEVLVVVGALVQLRKLVADPVEPFEQDVEASFREVHGRSL